MPQQTNASHLLGLDLGDKRVGVALASLKTGLPQPLTTLDNDQSLISNINKLVKEYNVQTVVVGLPRSLSGRDSQQTTKIIRMVNRLADSIKATVVTEDEALSSVRAEEDLKQHGKIFAKEDIDKLAACYILEEYINRELV